MTTTTDPAIVDHLSVSTFDTTLRRPVEVIEGAGFRVFARIDHAAAAREAGLVMPPTVLLLYGNPKGGTPIMVGTPSAALERRCGYWEREGDDGLTRLSFHPIAPLLRDVGLPQELAKRLDPAQEILLKAVAP